MRNSWRISGPSRVIVGVCIAGLAAYGCSSTGSSPTAGSLTTTTPTRPASRQSVSSSVASTAPPTTVKIGSTTVATTIAPNPTAPATAAAVRVVRAMGYTPRDTDDYNYPDFTFGLHVIIGVATGSGTGYDDQSFFFVHDRFVGKGATDPSATVQMVWRSDSTIALSYAIYKPDDPMCCPLGGAVTVRYQWNGTRLVRLDQLPSVAARR